MRDREAAETADPYMFMRVETKSIPTFLFESNDLKNSHRSNEDRNIDDRY